MCSEAFVSFLSVIANNSSSSQSIQRCIRGLENSIDRWPPSQRLEFPTQGRQVALTRYFPHLLVLRRGALEAEVLLENLRQCRFSWNTHRPPNPQSQK